MEVRPEVAFFNTTSRSYRDEYDKATPEGYSFRVRREKVLRMLPDGTGKRILDLASGPGVMIRGLRAKGYEVVCVDAAPEMVELAKDVAAGDPMVSCEVGDAYALRFPDNSFDILTAMGLIEYLSDEPKFLREAARIVKSSGDVIITVPNIWSPWRLWNRALRLIRSFFQPRKSDSLLHREYTRKGFEDLLREHGFSPVETVYYNFKLIPFPLDRFFPRITAWQSRLFEVLDRTPLRFLATAFIVRATRRA